MIAVYSTDELGSSLALYDTDDELRDGLAADSWTDISAGLPRDLIPAKATAFLREHRWAVRGSWTYRQEHDDFRATAYAVL